MNGQGGNAGSGAGMTSAQARMLEWAIIGLCVAALVMVFQPFSLKLYGIGAGLVVLGGLAFNLVPLCRPGIPMRTVVKAALVVLLLLLLVAGLAIGSAWLYGVYLHSQQQ
jgi:hypothetical protein